MQKSLTALFLTSLVSVSVFSLLGVKAQTPNPSTQAPPLPAPKPIAIPFNPIADGATFRPSDRPQSNDPTDSNDRAVIGADQRFPVRSRAFPWSAIGRIDWVINGKPEHMCTGTLIAKDLVLTNAHCLIDDQTKQPTKNPILFQPSMIEGQILEDQPARVVAFKYGKTYPQGNDDWAIFKLDRPLGDKYGYLGWRNLNLEDQTTLGILNQQIRLAGYSGDYPTAEVLNKLNLAGKDGDTAGVHVGCSINLAGQGMIAHNCDSMGGASGSSLIALFNDGKYYIVGLHNSWRELEPSRIPASWRERCEGFSNGRQVTVAACRNFGVQVSRWAAQATDLRKQRAASAGK